MGYELSCPDNGTAPGCVLLPLPPSRGWGAVSVVTALLVMTMAVILWKQQLTADLCRLLLGAGNPLGERSSCFLCIAEYAAHFAYSRC